MIETALVLSNVSSFCVLVIPRPGAMSRLRPIAALSAAVAFMQIVIEGGRWQMAPSYALAAVFLLSWLLGPHVGPWLRAHRAVVVAAVAAGALSLVVSAVPPLVLPVFHFPQPTGPYGVGTVTYRWVDTNRAGLFSRTPNDRRELMVRIWYPATPAPALPRAPYIENSRRVTPVLARLLHVPSFFFSYFRYVRSNAVERAPVAGGDVAYPVLIYLTGLGGFPSASMFQIQALVSHGYIVAGLDQPGGAAAVSFPGGREISLFPRDRIQPLINQSIEPTTPPPVLRGHRLPLGIIPYFADDVSFSIDRLALLNEKNSGDLLAGHMDLERIGVFGVSLGAMVASEAALRDRRIDAVLMMDAAMPADVVEHGLNQPSMWMTRPASTMRLERSRTGGWTEKDIAETLSSMKAVFEEHQPGSAYYLSMPGMFHVNFTDAPYWSPITRLLGITGPVDGKGMLRVVDAYSLAFFDAYLRGLPEPLLERPAEDCGVSVRKR